MARVHAFQGKTAVASSLRLHFLGLFMLDYKGVFL